MASDDPRHCDGGEHRRETLLPPGRHVFLTRDDIINHIKFMKTLEPAYAEKALKWHSGMTPWLELPTWQELCK
jgi:hypothetical protein